MLEDFYFYSFSYLQIFAIVFDKPAPFHPQLENLMSAHLPDTVIIKLELLDVLKDLTHDEFAKTLNEQEAHIYESIRGDALRQLQSLQNNFTPEALAPFAADLLWIAARRKSTEPAFV